MYINEDHILIRDFKENDIKTSQDVNIGIIGISETNYMLC